MLSKLLSHGRHNAVAYLALFLALGGTAVAAKPLLTGADIQDNSVTGADVQDNSLGGADILESSLARIPNADTLGGIESADFVQGRGTLLSNRIVFVPDAEKTLLQIPGLGELRAHCFPTAAVVRWHNTTTSPVDAWVARSNGPSGAALVAPGENPLVAVSSANPDPPDFDSATLSLGMGNDPDPRRTAVVQAFAFQSANGAPCGFQVQGTLWVSP